MYSQMCRAIVYAQLAAMSDHQDAVMVHGLDPKSDDRESSSHGLSPAN